MIRKQGKCTINKNKENLLIPTFGDVYFWVKKLKMLNTKVKFGGPKLKIKLFIDHNLFRWLNSFNIKTASQRKLRCMVR